MCLVSLNVLHGTDSYMLTWWENKLSAVAIGCFEPLKHLHDNQCAMLPCETM